MGGQTFDFVIVGGGTSGCLLAARLADTPSKPSILLIEDGPRDTELILRRPNRRYVNFRVEELARGYSVDLDHVRDGYKIPYARGKGLGGSTILNVMMWDIGSAADYELWASLTGDDSWNWKRVQERFKKIEHVHDETTESFKDYVAPIPEAHGFDGPVHVTYPSTLSPGVRVVIEALEQIGVQRATDINSGNPLGFGISPDTIYKNERVIAADVLLNKERPNIEILTETAVSKVLFEGKRAIGVEIGQRRILARKSVILTAGAIDTPKILMLSGIGPSAEMQKHGIPILHHLPGIGKNLTDHPQCSISAIVKPGLLPRPPPLEGKEADVAAASWENSRTGPYADGLSFPHGFIKLPGLYETKEFLELDKETQEFLRKPNIPHTEFAPTGQLIPIGAVLAPGELFQTWKGFFMNPQSKGEVTLRSANPAEPPHIEFNALASPYDKRVAIETLKFMMRVIESPGLKSCFIRYIAPPKSDSDEDLWEYISTPANSTGLTWHANGTAKMGKSDDPLACVDPATLEVYGVEGLIVADLSICPTLINGHTMFPAYMIGEAAAEKIIEGFGL